MTSVVPRTETLTAEGGEVTGIRQSSRRPQRRPVPSLLKRGAYLQALAALLWLPQAGILAYAIGRLADTGFDNSVYYSAAGIFILGCLRSILESAGAAKAFDAAPQHHYLVRSVDPVDPPLTAPHVDYLLARGPFAVEAEEALLREHRIDVVVSKDSGGEATYGKIAAARRLGLPVVLVERERAADGHRAGTVEEAVRLVDHLAGSLRKRGV